MDAAAYKSLTQPSAGTLYYFDGHGRAEFIRLMLRKANVSFEDRRLSFEEWPAMKPMFPPGGLPCWDDGVNKLNETNSVGRYLAKKYGFHGKDAKQCWDIDATFDFLYECWNKMAIPTVSKNMEEETAKAYFEACQQLMDKMGAKLDKSKTKFLCGNALTIVDFMAAAIFFSYILNDMHSCGDFYTKKC